MFQVLLTGGVVTQSNGGGGFLANTKCSWQFCNSRSCAATILASSSLFVLTNKEEGYCSQTRRKEQNQQGAR
eukprot:577502-Hanusia_phi.AAC.1